MKNSRVIEYLGTVCSYCSARTWTSTTGKPLEGDLVRVQSGKAYIRAGKRVGAVPIKGLSRSDQAFIKKWITDQQLARLSSIRKFIHSRETL